MKVPVTSAEVLEYCRLIRAILYKSIYARGEKDVPPISVKLDDSISINQEWWSYDVIAFNLSVGEFVRRVSYPLSLFSGTPQLVYELYKLADEYLKWKNYAPDRHGVEFRSEGDLIPMINDLTDRRRAGLLPSPGEYSLVSNLGGSEYHWCQIEYVSEAGEYHARVVSFEHVIFGRGSTPRAAVNEAHVKLLLFEGRKFDQSGDSSS